MRIVLDVHGGVPTYRQIVEQVRFLIDSGQLQGDDELPSTRALAQALGINPMTVSKAYGLLEEEGLVAHRPGLPLTVRTRSAAELERARERQLRAALVPAAQVVKQLGLSQTRAVHLLRQVLQELDAQEE